MEEIFDVSVRLSPRLPIWPGSSGMSLTGLQRIERGDEANVSRLRLDVHTGTHVDAPWHFLEQGGRVEDLDLHDLIGPVVLLDLDAEVLDRRRLEEVDLPEGTSRLLFKTSNSHLWSRSEFTPRYAALTPDGAQWVVDQGLRLVGIDYLSIQRFEDDPETHRILLRAGVVIVEGLDLSGVTAGIYELLCLPVLLEGAEGAPARVVLRRRKAEGTGTP